MASKTYKGLDSEKIKKIIRASKEAIRNKEHTGATKSQVISEIKKKIEEIVKNEN